VDRDFLEGLSRSAERAFLEHLPGVGAKSSADADLVRALVGFGDGMVFLVNVDEDDLQWLEGYRM